jgi:uncharacterized membrane protein YczE
MRAPVHLRGGVAVRLVILLAGLFCCAAGMVAALKSRLGLGPWAVLAQGIAKHAPLSFGNATIAISLVLLLTAWRLGAQLGLGTLADAVLVGVFIDSLTAIDWVSRLDHAALAWRTALLAGGVVSFSLGSALYLATAFGGGPRDALMLALWSRTGARIAYCRVAIELAALTAGFVLGGTVGVGTVALATLVGPCLQASFRVFVRAGLARPPALVELSPAVASV